MWIIKLMLDHLSDYPFPGIIEGTKDIMFSLLIRFPDEESFKRKSGLTHNDLRNKVQNILLKDDPQYSYTAWILGAKDNYVDKIVTYLNRRIKSRKKIKACIKSTALMFLLYRDTLERMYQPGGVFETKSSLQWNPMLQSM